MSNKIIDEHSPLGQSFEDYLDERGIKDECNVRALRNLKSQGHQLTDEQEAYLNQFNGQFEGELE